MRAGFSLIEMVVAMSIVVVVTAAVFALMDPAHGVFRTVPQAIDLQQRLRVAADAISREVIMAGAGGGKFFAPLLPRRRGPLRPDGAGTFFDDRLSILYFPADGPKTTLRVATDGTTVLYVNPQPGCPAARPLCGFEVDMLVAVLDETGMYDTFRVAAVEIDPPALIYAAPALSKSYAVGATVAQIVSATYWLRPDLGAGTSELMKYDGRETDLPITDDVTDLRFEYYGDPVPPAVRKLLGDPEGPWTSYGPKPPEIGVDDPATPAYGPGENCTFEIVSGATVPRRAMLILGPPTSIARLDGPVLTDGPWCPDPAAANRFDADLLRVRTVRVRLTVRDRSITFDVSPRNLNLLQ